MLQVTTMSKTKWQGRSFDEKAKFVFMESKNQNNYKAKKKYVDIIEVKKTSVMSPHVPDMTQGHLTT
jgi:hypothetical protein